MNTASKLVLLAAMASTMVAMPALSMTQTWDFSSGSTPFDADGVVGNSLTMNSGGVVLKVTAWSDTGDVGGDDTIQSATLTWAQSGALGVRNRDEQDNSPNHAIDSVQGSGEGSDGDSGAIPGEDDDMLLLEFSEAVDLTGIDLSWAYDAANNSRADVSILYWNGTGTGALAGETWNTILTKGYVSAGNYADVNLAYQAVNTAGIMATKWLVGVYNTAFGSGSGLGAGNDGFKLDLVTTATRDGGGEVPVPGTLALLLLGMLTLRTSHRRGSLPA